MLDDATTLNPRLRDSAVLDDLRNAWAAGRRIRITELMAPGLAERFADAALNGSWSFFEKHVNEVHCVAWSQVHRYPEAGETSDFAVMPEAMQLFMRDIPALASAVTGQALHRVADEGLAIHWYTKGSYLDVHTDQGADRLVAYVLGLTRESWPAERGGHLEFLEPDERTVIDRIAPGFDTLDLFTIYPLTRPHRIPILQDHVVRLSVNGWLTGEPRDPREA